MAIDADLLKILVCPETHLPLRLANPEQLAALNADISNGQLKDRAGNLVTNRIEAALIRDDGRILFPVREGIPMMLPSEVIQLP